MRLAAEAQAQGYRLETFDTLASTNEEAMRRARLGTSGPLWIVAATQTAGRGRHGRAWTSPRGNLYASLLLSDPASPRNLPELGFVCGVALAEALVGFVGSRLTLKWPNDALLDGAKVAGILLESRQSAETFDCVAGIGVNCASHPEGLAYPASDLSAVGHAVSVEEVFEQLSGRLATWLARWDRGRRFDLVREAWLTHARGIGETIEVQLTGRRLRGIFRTLDERGRLILETSETIECIEAGDVFFPGTMAEAEARKTMNG